MRWKRIHVDLVPAVQIPICETDVTIGDELRLGALDLQWRRMVLDTGFYHMIATFKNDCCGCEYTVLKPSITQTEMDFMDKVVSRRHKFAYRFIKHFINGADGNETFKECCVPLRPPENCDPEPNCLSMFWYDMPSYALKTLLYQHVIKCKSDRFFSKCIREMLTDLADCVTNNNANITTILRRELCLCQRLSLKIVSDKVMHIESSLKKLQYGKAKRVTILAHSMMCIASKYNFLRILCYFILVCVLLLSFLPIILFYKWTIVVLLFFRCTCVYNLHQC